ncbi:EAL domain-containing protein [Escherichia coli]|uniref:EAL domain-containing protein n=3 Tax=Escherichia coli TaxID=562 RepID=UPI0003EE9725|nr:EAL domain-containing protein [Escherichia coli]EFB1944869.1 EAL domain-containing protein [Escherichia coli]EFH0950162.1 EAL domain-containing protein [Escherichia coli]KAE9718254.1 EAL domain-containing protein [Escherichia coli]MDA6156279.1 EAL domain-containing protein [Escherichia coli]OKX70236.1 diguanylate phosphodiesterase [Escherichia coli]
MSLLLEKCKFYAEPIYSPSGKFYGMEMLTHFYNKNVKLNPQTIINSLDYSAKKSLLKKQLIDVKLMSRFFLKNSAFCSLNIDEEMAHILISDSSLLNLLESIPFLWLEVNERAIRKQPRQSFAIQKLSEVCRLMMDDFGTGNTSYSALRSDIFSAVKIDKKLLWNNTTDKNDLLCIVTQLRMLCPIVIAEGVETPNYKKEAIRAGAYGLQGWLFPGCYFDNLDV